MLIPITHLEPNHVLLMRTGTTTFPMRVCDVKIDSRTTEVKVENISAGLQTYFGFLNNHQVEIMSEKFTTSELIRGIEAGQFACMITAE